MKKEMVALIDGENVSAKRAKEIVRSVRCLGRPSAFRVYHRQNDPVTRQWTEEAKAGAFMDICLFGGPEKDKVDRKMQKDARAYLRRPDVGAVCIVSSDGGFRCLAEDAAAAGKKLYVVGEEHAPARLRDSCSRFVQLA
jgi:uncharacterized LabA/DUF88 family protein